MAKESRKGKREEASCSSFLSFILAMRRACSQSRASILPAIAVPLSTYECIINSRMGIGVNLGKILAEGNLL